jgi:hypothetical protein
MHTRFKLTVVITALSLTAACMNTAPAKPESQIDPNANIPQLNSYGWQPAQNGLVSTDVTQRKFDEGVRKAIETTLTHKGYSQTATDPDLIVSYEIGEYDKKKSSSPFSVGVGMGSWGGNVGGGVGMSTPVGGSSATKENRLTIHVVSRKADKEVWVGTMTGTLAPGSSTGDINAFVAQTLSDFPAKRP